MRTYYPIMLKLEGKKVVVIGGGKVAERKVKGLLGTGAVISVISPEATDGLQRLAREGLLVWHQKSYSSVDTKEACIIFVATNDKAINQSVKNGVKEYQLVMLADDPEGSDFHTPAFFSRGRLSIAVSTGGASPTLARKIREELEQQFDDSYEEYLDFLYATRQWIVKEVTDASLKRKLLTAIVDPAFLHSHSREEDFRRLYEELK